MSTKYKTIKVFIVVFGMLFLGIGFLITFGMYSMEIEDTYGDNQGDIVINHDTQELGQITKTWTRFYIINDNETLDVNHWWDNKKIEIYKVLSEEHLGTDLSYSDIERLNQEKKIELRKRLR